MSNSEYEGDDRETDQSAQLCSAHVKPSSTYAVAYWRSAALENFP